MRGSERASERAENEREERRNERASERATTSGTGSGGGGCDHRGGGGQTFLRPRAAALPSVPPSVPCVASAVVHPPSPPWSAF